MLVASCYKQHHTTMIMYVKVAAAIHANLSLSHQQHRINKTRRNIYVNVLYTTFVLSIDNVTASQLPIAACLATCVEHPFLSVTRLLSPQSTLLNCPFTVLTSHIKRRCHGSFSVRLHLYLTSLQPQHHTHNTTTAIHSTR